MTAAWDDLAAPPALGRNGTLVLTEFVDEAAR